MTQAPSRPTLPPAWLRKCERCGRFVPRRGWGWLTGNWPDDEGYTEAWCPAGFGCRR